MKTQSAKKPAKRPAKSTRRSMTKLPDGSGFFVVDIGTKRKPRNPIFWNPGNKVVHDHRNGEIIQPDTDIERRKRGLPTPWLPKYVENETRMPDIP